MFFFFLHIYCVSPLSELLEDNAVGKALSADTNPFQHSIAPQLIQNQVGVQFASLQEEGLKIKR